MASRPGPNGVASFGIVHSSVRPDGTIVDQGYNPNYKPAGPQTLSKAAFLKKKPGGVYQNYLSYLASHRGQQIGAANTDPFAMNSPQDINTTVNRFIGMYGNPQSDSQIQSSAQGMIDPIIAAITKTAHDNASAAGASIKGLTDSYASELGKLNLAAPYQSATLQQAAVDSALNDTLSNAGSDLASQLRSRLSAIQSDPAVEQTASGLQGMGQAAGGTQVALGSDALSSLLAQGAAAGTYGASLPGIARLSGIQNIGRVNQQAQSDINTGTQQALSQLPSLVQAMRSDNNSLRANRANAGADLFTTLTGQNVTKATAKAGLENQNFDNSLSYANTYGYDPTSGTPTVAAVKAVNAATTAAAKVKASKQPKPLTPAQKTSLSKAADDLRYGVAPKQTFNSKTQAWMDVPNTGTPNSSYGEAYQALVDQGATPTFARALVNRLYKPGEFGRPYSKAKQDAVNRVKKAIANGTYGPQKPKGK